MDPSSRCRLRGQWLSIYHQILQPDLCQTGVKKLHARPRTACSNGKIEKFNRFLDSFVADVKLKNPRLKWTLTRARDTAQSEGPFLQLFDFEATG
jgi:transposase InsO family protein